MNEQQIPTNASNQNRSKNIELSIVETSSEAGIRTGADIT